MDNIIKEYNTIILISITALLFIMFVWNLILSVRLSGMNDKYKKFMRGSSGKNFEGMLLGHIENMEAAIERVNIISEDLINVKNQMD
ncbi:MAG TPA: DUF4446 family protein, partial [Bacillota bacterium]|nr:DUF4446 family protein [Bacillota bacterium]